MTSTVRVLEVKDASIMLSKSNPPIIELSAVGNVVTSDWSNPSLVLWVYITAPEDGIQDVDFVAERPYGTLIVGRTRISASVSIGPVDPQNYWGDGKHLVGFLVHAATNSVDFMLD